MRLIIHVGMQRTGSTFLQQEIFLKSDKINYIDHENKDIKYDLINLDSANEDWLESKIRGQIDNLRVNLLSEENIYTKMFNKVDDRSYRLYKLKKMFPEAKILIGIRDYLDLMESWYKKYIMEGGTCNYYNFAYKEINLDKIMDYDWYLQDLIKEFGEKRVLIYYYEDLRDDKQQTIKKICQFIGIDIPDYKDIKYNKGYTDRQLWICRIINHLFRTYINTKGIIPMKHQHQPHRFFFRRVMPKIRGDS